MGLLKVPVVESSLENNKLKMALCVFPLFCQFSVCVQVLQVEILQFLVGAGQSSIKSCSFLENFGEFQPKFN